MSTPQTNVSSPRHRAQRQQARARAPTPAHQAPEPEPPKPEASSQQTLGTAERLGYRVGRGIAMVLLVAVVAVPVAVVWWLIVGS